MSAIVGGDSIFRTEPLSAELQQQVGAEWSAAIGRELSAAEVADHWAQCLVCGDVLIQVAPELQPARGWLIAQAPPWQAAVLKHVFAIDRPRSKMPPPLCENGLFWLTKPISELRWSIGSSDDWLDGDGCFATERLYEAFIAEHAPGERRRKGVFYTPATLVQFMVAEVDRLLSSEFHRPSGLLATGDEPPVTLLDPAAGAGAFLCEAVTAVHARFVADGRHGWNAYAASRLLPSLLGFELQPAACVLAQLNLAIRLAATGFDFSKPAPINVRLGNALQGPPGRGGAEGGPMIVVGNPPFSSLSENSSAWITKLVRGDGSDAGYLQIDGERLGERKTWLHDDYVKFLRLAQWLVDQAGSGIVALVTNHGYLDNATFRILRRQIARSLPHVSVIDLHGNRKKGETAPSGEADENVFGLDQGVAIGFFRKTASAGDGAMIEHADVWGSRAGKLRQLATWRGAASQSKFARLAPSLPDYRWTPAGAASHAEYLCGVRLNDAMPTYTTAPVTARDGLVVAFRQEELLQRIERFADLSICDDQVRRELFPRPRSARYPAGDTRSWKLSEVRRMLAAEINLRQFVQRCLYRPFDWRFVFWHPAMIDWPRSEVMRHLLGSDPEDSDSRLALIARRQMLPTQPCNFFWATDCLTLDGVVRSDNRGSEAIFPLAANSTSLDWFQYAYAMFSSPTYRIRYADDLRRDFPRVLQPRCTDLYNQLAACGRKLIDLHLLRGKVESAVADMHGADALLNLPRGYPAWTDGAVTVDADRTLLNCSSAAWQFRVGGHQPARKWLADRRGRQFTAADRQHYQRMIGAIEQSLVVVDEVEAIILNHGGWPRAFSAD